MGTAHRTPKARGSSIKPRELSETSPKLLILLKHTHHRSTISSETLNLNNKQPALMDASLLQPLYVDCSVEYELDMTRFPGWDDPEARAQPTLMLPYPDRPCNSSCPSVDDELQNVLRKLSTTEDEFQTLLREFIMTEDELQSFVQDFCPSLESSEDDLPSIIDDVFSYADILLTMTGAITPSDSDHAQSPETFESATQTDDDVMPDGHTLVDFLSDSYVSDPTSPRCFSSIDTLSSDSYVSDPTSPRCFSSIDTLSSDSYVSDPTSARCFSSIDTLSSDSYVSDPTSAICFSSIDTLSSTPTVECGIDFLLHSQELHHSCRDFLLHSHELHHSCRKRQISDVSDQPSAKRQCNHGDDSYNELLSTFITDSSENEMSYGFSGCVRD